MKLADLERHLKSQGCHFEREGGNHTLWKNPATGKVSPVPRYREDQGCDREVHLPPVGHCSASKVAIIAPRDGHGV